MATNELITRMKASKGKYALVFDTDNAPNVRLYVDDALVYSDIPSDVIYRMAELIKTTYGIK